MNLNIPAIPRPSDELEQHRRAVRLNPRDANAHALLGLALLKQRQLEEGVAGLRRALALNPKVKGLHAVLAAALFELEQYEEAAEAYRHALRFQDAADLHQGLADALMRLRRHDEAETSALRAAELAPQNAAVLLSLAGVFHAQKRLEEAAGILERVVALEPDNLDARFDLGSLLHRLHRHAEAIVPLRAVADARPDHVAALRYLSVSYRHLRQFDNAVASLEQALAREPDDHGLLTDLGGVLQMQGKLSQAVPVLQRVLDAAPDNENALSALAHTRFTLGDWQEALRLARRLLEVVPSPAVHSMMLFMLSHCCLDPDELTREHFSYGERWESPLLDLRQPHANDRDPGRPLRVGIVSADLHNHAVAYFLAPVLVALKESRELSIYAYYNNRVDDAMTQNLRAHTAVWRSIVDLNDEEAERLIRADGIDILIDLAGHSALNRLPLFARKPAPIQATWIGYAGTTGLRGMDYVLSEQHHLPQGRYDDQFTENIVRLPLALPFLPEQSAPPVNDLPALRNGYLTFGSFHRASKLSREVIVHWASLLHAIPDARMLLGGLQTGTEQVLVDWFEAEGISRERLLLRQRASVYEYLGQHHDVDVCLCPFPYTGSTTIGHALWMGVPTLAAVGATNPSHASAGFMSHLGLHSFITEDEETYIKLGVFLSQNLSALAAMRASMRQRFVDSMVGYPGVAAAGLELGLRRMWQRWCAGEASAPLRVELSELAAQAAAD